MKYYLAVDIGASSGRLILGHREEGTKRFRKKYTVSETEWKCKTGILPGMWDQLFARDYFRNEKMCGTRKNFRRVSA